MTIVVSVYVGYSGVKVCNWFTARTAVQSQITVAYYKFIDLQLTVTLVVSLYVGYSGVQACNNNIGSIK
jgi:hypothetical protein